MTVIRAAITQTTWTGDKESIVGGAEAAGDFHLSRRREGVSGIDQQEVQHRTGRELALGENADASKR